MDNEIIKERIRALLNTQGRTEEETIAYIAKARELLDKYNLSQWELNKESFSSTITDDISFGSSTRHETWAAFLFTRISRLFDCYPYFNSKFGVAKNGRRAFVKAFHIIGHKEDTEIVEYMFGYINRSTISCFQEELKKAKIETGNYNTRRDSIQFRQAFCYGFVSRVCQRVEEMREGSLRSHPNMLALVVSRKSSVQSWVKQHKSFSRGKTVTHNLKDWDAYRRGIDRGNTFHLHQGIKGRSVKELGNA